MSLRLRVLDALNGSQNRAVTVRDDRFAYQFVCHSLKERHRAERMFAKEAGTIAWLARELRPDDIFFDVGANIGVYTIFAARRLGPGGTVVAFEPHIPNAGSLIENILLNQQQDRVRLVTSALTSGERFDNFNYQSLLPASSTSQFGASSYEGTAFQPVFIEIKHGCTLDTLCSRGVLPRPSIVKIDVDGLDFEVLEGMSGLLGSSDRPRSIQVELGSESKPKIIDLLAHAGYELKEKHWTEAGLAHIAKGNDPESYPHYGIFEHRPLAARNSARSTAGAEDSHPVRAFPQIICRKLLPFSFLRAGYSRLTNNEFAFRILNRDFVRGFSRLKRPTLSSVGQRIASDLKRSGIAFASMSELFEPVLLDQLRAAFDGYAAQFAKARAGNGKLKGKEVFLDTIHKAHTFTLGDVTSRYLGAPQLAAIAAEYMGLVPRFVGSSFWHTKPAPSSDRKHSQLWHRDYNDRRLVKVFLYLNDVGPTNGCFEYVTGSQVGGPLGKAFDAIGRDGYRAYPDQEALQDILAELPVIDLAPIPAERQRGPDAPWHSKPSRVQCTAPQATLIFCDTFGIHRGGFVEEGYRDLVMATFSTNFNCHKPHFGVTAEFAATLDPFMRKVFGLE